MTLEQYWTILLNQWRLVVLCFLLGGVGAAIGSKLLMPHYQSTALVEVELGSANSQPDYNNLLANEQLVQTETLLAVSDPVLRTVVSHYPGMTVQQLMKEVTTSYKINTQLFEIDVKDTSPTRAASLANDIAQTLIRQQSQLAQQKEAQSQQQLQQDINTTQQKISQLSAQITALQTKGGSQAQISALQTQLDGLQQHNNQEQTLLPQLSLAEAQSGNFMVVAQPAQPNFARVSPSTLLNTIAGFLVGLFLGTLLVVLIERIDPRVRTSEALSLLLGWPMLSTIVKEDEQDNLIDPKGHSVNVEAYRILRTNIGFAAASKPLQTLMVTSAMPRNGKSIIAANLAIFMARTGKKTLLIDADLRSPTQHKKFAIPADQMGLTDAIMAFNAPLSTSETVNSQFTLPTMPIDSLDRSGEISIGQLNETRSLFEPFVFVSKIPNLYIMPSGPLPPNPPELLDSKATQVFFSTLASSGFEIIIFDAPAVLGLSDASILASKVDGTVVVSDITCTNKHDIRCMKAILDKTGTRVLGCVVNKRRRKRTNTLYYGHASNNNNKEKNEMSRNVTRCITSVSE